MPLIRRVPKRGFTNIFARDVATVNVGDLGRFPEGTVVTPALLVQHGIVRKRHDAVKVLGDGELTKKLVVEAHAFSAGARSKIEAAGGKAGELKA
jgi:large subunit ribosomal protein L15